jgi:hypothetical protein
VLPSPHHCRFHWKRIAAWVKEVLRLGLMTSVEVTVPVAVARVQYLDY